MGGNHSHAIPPIHHLPFFALSFRRYDKLVLLHADSEVLHLVRAALLEEWSRGIQEESSQDGAHKIKLFGSPFSEGTGKADSIAIKRACCKILGNLYHVAGWEAIVSSDLSQTEQYTTWFFQKNEAPHDAARSSHVVCLSMSSDDKLQLINAPGYLHDVMGEAVAAAYGPGIQSEERLRTDYELKLNGYPWLGSKFEEGVFARRALLEIIRRFDAHKFRFYTTANLKGTADCLFFRPDPDCAPGETRFMMISLNSDDRFRLIDAPSDVVEVVRASIRQSWPAGVQEERRHRSCFEFKLSGRPWCCSGWEAVSARLLITALMQNLLPVGWAVVSSLDVTRRVNDKAVFVLRSCSPASLWHFCLSPSDVDKLRLINTREDLVSSTAQVIRSSWAKGIQREEPRHGSFEWKLGGCPWSGDLVAVHLMLMLLADYSRRGWRVICSADVSAKFVSQENGPDYPIDVHAWFLCFTGKAAGQAEARPAPPPLPPPAPSAPSDAPPSYDQAVFGAKEHK